MSRVSVVIPTLRGVRFLPTCLDALRRQTRQADEVLVVDDGSADGTSNLLATLYPEVTVIRHAVSLGVAPSFNDGARRSTGSTVVLLNDDTEAETGWLENLCGPLDQDDSWGFAASKLLLFDRRTVLHSAGDFFGRDGMPGSRGVWEEDRGQHDGWVETFGPCGAAAAYRRGLLEDVGFFDESFGSYCEDVDLSFRARLAGYRCRFVPSARVYHRLSATGGGPLASFHVGRNAVWVLAQDLPSPLLRRYWSRILARQASIAGEALRHWNEAAARARLRGQISGLRSLASRRERRRSVQGRRRVSVGEIDRALS